MEGTGDAKNKLPDLSISLENHQKKVQEMTKDIEAIKEMNDTRIKMREKRLQQLEKVEANISKNKNKMKTHRNSKVELKV